MRSLSRFWDKVGGTGTQPFLIDWWWFLKLWGIWWHTCYACLCNMLPLSLNTDHEDVWLYSSPHVTENLIVWEGEFHHNSCSPVPLLIYEWYDEFSWARWNISWGNKIGWNESNDINNIRVNELCVIKEELMTPRRLWYDLMI